MSHGAHTVKLDFQMINFLFATIWWVIYFWLLTKLNILHFNIYKQKKNQGEDQGNSIPSWMVIWGEYSFVVPASLFIPNRWCLAMRNRRWCQYRISLVNWTHCRPSLCVCKWSHSAARPSMVANNLLDSWHLRTAVHNRLLRFVVSYWLSLYRNTLFAGKEP